MDGNGRIGRFLMNSMFASGGYPWTIIRVANRTQYLHSLEIAGIESNIEPFIQFIRQEMQQFPLRHIEPSVIRREIVLQNLETIHPQQLNAHF